MEAQLQLFLVSVLYYYYYYYYYYYLLQLSLHSVAVVFTLVLTKQIRMDVIGQLYAPATLPRERFLDALMQESGLAT